MSREFFDQIADQLAGFLPPALRGFSSRHGSRNLKVWYGERTKEHYEAQLLGIGGRTLLEIGFHAEHPSAEANDAAIGRLTEREETWRRELGRDPTAGAFRGARSSPWRRLSETWDGPGLTSPEAGVEAAERLALYIRVLEPVLTGSR